MNVDQIRETFVNFYVQNRHLLVPSASLVPHGDPTLLFTNAGMVPFKPYFTGLAEPPSTRMVTVQKCFRTTDIESVGDYSHLTFFEMLGNFSIGDYFKEGAISFAWELLTQHFKLPPDKLWISIFLTDDEAHDLWRAIGVPEERIHRYPEENNYWFSGDVGPCGPNSEIFVDRGPRDTCDDCRAGTCKPNLEPDCGRFLEIWNLVFMTLYQAEDGTRTELPRKNIDTGSGLERVACILQNKETVYETDLFTPIIKRIEEISLKHYGIGNDERDRTMRILAEHTRAAVFLLADGVTPSNDGRGYVPRRLIRRATHFGRSLVGNKHFLDPVGRAVIEVMSPAYPALLEAAPLILGILSSEEQKFARTLFKGRRLIDEIIKYRDFVRDTLQRAAIDRRARVNWASRELPLARMFQSELFNESVANAVLQEIARVLPPRPWLATAADLRRASEVGVQLTGRALFIFWDTYGFPPDLTIEVAQSAGLPVTVDAMEAFEREMDAQRERGRSRARFVMDTANVEEMLEVRQTRRRKTKFVGYRHLTSAARVWRLSVGGAKVNSAAMGDSVEIMLNQTPFYPEGGGQAGDTGEIAGPYGRVRVEDTQAAAEGLIVHRGVVVEGRIAVNDTVRASVDTEKRRASQRNHTATHLLHAALREVLGTHVKQAGSLVAPDRLRFDFTHIEATKPEELAAVQRLVNEKIRADIEVHWEEQPYDEAIRGGAMALFGEKYQANVRVVGICEPASPDGRQQTANSKQQRVDGEHHHEMRCFSKELCGGTHCHRTGEIGTFVIASESSVGSGLRRIEALTGPLADAYVLEQQETINTLSRRLNAQPAELEQRIEALQAELDAERRRLQQLERQAGRAEAGSLVDAAERIDGASLVVARVPAANAEAMREMGDLLRDRLGSAVVVLGAVVDDRPSFLAMVTKDLTGRVHAGNLIKQVAAVAGGGGGGRPDMAQAGGKDASKVDAALDLARDVAREQLRA